MATSRWLGVGAVVGFSLAMGVSCSPVVKCSASNCATGCCDAAGTCQLTASSAQCGGLGGKCVACSTTQACQLGRCVEAIAQGGGGGATGGSGGGATGGSGGGATGGSGGGATGGSGGGATGGSGGGATGGSGGGVVGGGAGGGAFGGGGGAFGGGIGGGGGSACSGCLLPSGACVPLSMTSVINCGSGGMSCRFCNSGELCVGGSCIPPAVNKVVGSSCLNSAECQLSLGAGSICKQSTSSGNGTYTGGYCTLPCGTGNQCPGGSTCVGLLPLYGESDIFCWDNCSATDRCRTPGYACYGLSTGNACWLDPIPPLDAGPPADKIGTACTSDSACINPPTTGGACLTRALGSNWPGGYCTRTSCVTNDECSADGGALCLGFTANDVVCVRKCADSTDGGQSNCRNGYLCQAYFSNQPDGGQQPSSDGFCAPPPAPAPSTVGDPCTTNVDCEVPAGAIADCIPPTLVDGGPSGVPGGECTRYDCATDSDCSADGGARCFSLQQGTACFRMCPVSGVGQSTCRTSYVCGAYGAIDGGSSADGLCSPSCNAPGASCAIGATCNPQGYCL